MTETKSDWIKAALREHEGALVRYAAQITGDLDRARDVVQDTFLKLCAEDPARLDGHVVQWLFTVCRNRALDIQRKEQRMKPLDDLELAALPGREHSPAAQAEHNENTGRAQRFMKHLPPNQQEVVRLKFQNGLSYKEIAGVTNLSVTNVGFLIHTALKTLRQQMTETESTL
jgi:RNA polymerase sigma-70 factor (ECF subfamily)